MRTLRMIPIVLSGLLLGVVLTGCGVSALEKGSPEAAVHSLLQLRSELATDPALYASYVETPMAEALASDSASRPVTQSAPTPEWNTPEATEESTSAAKVTVRWKADSDFPSWAKVTVFSLKKSEGRWLVVDATNSTNDATTTPKP